MSNEVFANGLEISCKSGDGKSVCEFPDVCMTPPTSPATPMGVPIPYPNTGFSRDTTKGSRTVKIDKKEVMLRNKSYYKTSTGDEAGCATPAKKGIITGTIKGKVYFISWSPNVKIEGNNVVRTSDMTTHNHASYPGNGSVPTIDIEGVALALSRIENDKCSCCGQAQHMRGSAESMEAWYAQKQSSEENKERIKSLINNCSDKERMKAGCSCYKRKPKTRILPTPPCDVFYIQESKSTYKEDKSRIVEDYNDAAPSLRVQLGVTPRSKIMGPHRTTPRSNEQAARWQATQQLNHLVPKSAGGCPTGIGNLEANEKLCNVCKDLDKQFSDFQ